jgi:hypothetical protein
LCERKPWPFADRQFDFASCTHVLEDLRDPLWVCSELQRVAKAGYIETPSRIVEQSRGVEHPLYAGFYHHRWLVSVEEGALCFRFKPHSLHTLKGAIVADLGCRLDIAPEHANVCFEWRERFKCREVLEFEESAVAAEMCAFAAGARCLPGLMVRRRESWRSTAGRWLYYRRLSRGGWMSANAWRTWRFG